MYRCGTDFCASCKRGCNYATCVIAIKNGISQSQADIAVSQVESNLHLSRTQTQKAEQTISFLECRVFPALSKAMQTLHSRLTTPRLKKAQAGVRETPMPALSH